MHNIKYHNFREQMSIQLGQNFYTFDMKNKTDNRKE
jgi:hypothetical protein